MNILAVDDEKLALEVLVNAIPEIVPDADIYSFRKPSEAMELAADIPCDIAYLDIKMRGMTGLELAKRLKDINGKINIRR